jgi:hypothetical protein
LTQKARLVTPLSTLYSDLPYDNEVHNGITELLVVQRFSIFVGGFHESREQILVDFTSSKLSTTFLDDRGGEFVDYLLVRSNGGSPRHEDFAEFAVHRFQYIHESIEGVLLHFIKRFGKGYLQQEHSGGGGSQYESRGQSSFLCM